MKKVLDNSPPTIRSTSTSSKNLSINAVTQEKYSPNRLSSLAIPHINGVAQQIDFLVVSTPTEFFSIELEFRKAILGSRGAPDPVFRGEDIFKVLLKNNEKIYDIGVLAGGGGGLFSYTTEGH